MRWRQRTLPDIFKENLNPAEQQVSLLLSHRMGMLQIDPVSYVYWLSNDCEHFTQKSRVDRYFDEERGEGIKSLSACQEGLSNCISIDIFSSGMICTLLCFETVENKIKS